MTAVGPSIGLELMNLPGGHFTFVSLDSLPLTYMDSTIGRLLTALLKL